MDQITMTLPMYFQLFSVSFLCAISLFVLAIFAWLFVYGATKEKTPKPKGLREE